MSAIPQFAASYTPGNYHPREVPSWFASYEYNHAQCEEWHSHSQAQLTYASEGALQIHTTEGIWTLPPGRALWIPAGQPHRTHAQGKVISCNYYCADSSRIGEYVPLVLSQLAHQLLATLIQRTAGGAGQNEPTWLMEHLLRCELSQSSLATVPFLPLPRERRLKQVAQRLMHNPLTEEGIESLGSAVGASTRTLSRLFRHDTGLTFSQWRHQLFLLKSVSLMAQGYSVEHTARQLGYLNGSTFNTMFRKTLGETPQRYWRQLHLS
jgi:AraC-like DNA-binding protein